MAKTHFQSIDEYQAGFSGETKKRMQLVRALTHKLVPEAREAISYQIPAFKIGEKATLIHYCAFKKHLSLSSPWTAAFLKAFDEELRNYTVSKSVIQFPLDESLPLDFIRRILLFRKKEVENNMQVRNK